MSQVGLLQQSPEMLQQSPNGVVGQVNGPATNGNVRPGNSNNKPATGDASAPPAASPPPKTDKPRPHVCGTCSRSFARLEHLKRHERSHTKEKPFECPECTRCFARRDLLLRHQQKLHMTATPSSRPRGRRESASGSGTSGPGGRVRKNSVVNNNPGAPTGAGPAHARPRANTISHVDGATLGMIAAANATAVRRSNIGPGHSHHASLTGLPGPGGFEFRGMSTSMGQHGNVGLPKLDTHGLANLEVGGGALRTAPPYGGFQPDLDIDGFLFHGHGPGSTINPAQLHFNNSPHSLNMGAPPSPYNQAFPSMSANPTLMEDDDNFDWMTGFDSQMSFTANEQAVDESSPSAISTTSQSGISEVMLDGSNVPAQSSKPESMWPPTSMMQPPSQMTPVSFPMDPTTQVFTGLVSPPGTISPRSLHAQNGGARDPYFSTPPPLNPGPHAVPPPQVFHPPMMFNPDTPSTSSASVSGSARQSSITSVSTESITDATRQALLNSLSQPSHFSHTQRKQSFSSGVVPPSPGFVNSSTHIGASLPSTRDLQRYVAAYIQYFHPHLPFLHIGTLSFETPAYGHGLHSGLNGLPSALAGGSGCLILAMAAIGALYEFEPGPSKELFESAKKMIQLYLEERRKADLTAGVNGARSGTAHAAQNTPLWLVQAMLLNVVYGINCGDKTSGDIASTHCAALVSLARAAELAQPLPLGTLPSQTSAAFGNPMFSQHVGGDDLHMSDEMHASSEPWNLVAPLEAPDDQAEWHGWKVAEERKRTLYAVFILSSLLVAAYNHAPALTNSEILLDLPCDEDLWAAENAAMWHSRGGARLAEQKAVTFSAALGDLLSASARHHSVPQAFQQQFGAGIQPEHIPESELKPSTFGSFVLINALHNYIWETRQRHHARQWTTQETEAMHAHIEPALKAWQAAWASDPHHSLERPNPYGKSPLSADCIPLLDLAYVRLFVNLGRSKEAFWARDYDGMAHELARGSEIVQHADYNPALDPPPPPHPADGGAGGPHLNGAGLAPAPTAGQYTKRERHLRKAAFYAADSLSISDKLGVTFADFTSRELPLQSAMCAFDCAQVLAEWVSTVQERVGRYVGVLGRDDIDYTQVPGIMLLEDEDCKLLEKIAEVVTSAEMKMSYELSGMGGGASMAGMHAGGSGVGGGGLPTASAVGYGSKILKVTAYMLDKAAVWPVTRLMAQALETQAGQMNVRAENSVLHQE